MEYRDVAVIGVGQTEFGEHEDSSLMDLFVEAADEALADAGMDTDDVGSLYYGNLAGSVTDGLANVHAHIVDEMGMEPTEAMTYEGACASGSVAFHQAYKDVKAGYSDVALVGGSERLKSAGTDIGTEALATATKEDMTFPEVFAEAAEHYSDAYDVPMDDLKDAMADVARKNHECGSQNTKAQYSGEFADLEREDVFDSPGVAGELDLMDCCPMTDGGSAVLLAPMDVAEDLVEDPVRVSGTGVAAGGTMAEYGQDAIESFSRQQASLEAYDEAGIGPDDVDFAEVHDCFTVAEIIATEALGFHDSGEGYQAVLDGETRLEGETTINPSGGLKAKGHPVGATGTAQVYSAVKTLRGEYDHLDALDDADTALIDTLGGDFGTVASIVLQRE